MTKIKTMRRASQIINRWGIVLIVGLYLLLAVAYTFVVPIEEGPDEIAHFDYMRFIVAQRHLPLTLKERSQAGYKSDLPPLYHLLAAIPSSFVNPDGPPYLKRVHDFPRRQLIENYRQIHNTEDELMFPGQAEFLMWRFGRWLAVLFGAGVIVVTWLIARYFFPHEVGLQLGAAIVVGFIPRFTLTGAMLNYETLQALLTALILWLLIKLSLSTSKTSPIPWLKITFICLVLGLLIGLAMSTKYSTLLLSLEVVIVLWLVSRQQQWPRSKLIGLATLMVLSMMMVLVWWFGFILWNFNDMANLGLGPGLLKPILGTDASDTTSTVLMSWLGSDNQTLNPTEAAREPIWRWLLFFYHSFWIVNTGGFGLPLPIMLFVSGFICLVAASGVYQWWRRDHQVVPLGLTILLLHAAIFLPLPLFRFFITGNVSDTSQGRHWLFPAAAAIAILMVGGLREVTPQKWRLWLAPMILLWLLPWNLFQLWNATWGYAAPLPVQTNPEAVAQAQQRLDLDFVDSLRLVGYNPPTVSAEHSLDLELIWQATGINIVDYLTEVSLIDEAGTTTSQWFGFPLAGRYPLRAWDPGDVVRDTIQLPLLNLSPGDYQLRLRLIDPYGNPVDPTEGLLITELFLKPEDISQVVVPKLATQAGEFAALTSQNQSWFSRLRQGVAWLIGPLPPVSRPWTHSSEFVLWHPDGPHPYRYRETIMLVALVQTDETMPEVWLQDPSGQLWPPERMVGNSYIFIVEAPWASGDYKLRIKRGDSVVEEIESLLIVNNFADRQFEVPAFPHSLEANFANQVKLLGYDLPERQVEAGQGFPVTMYWQAPPNLPPQTNFIQFNQLLDYSGALRGGYDRLPLEDYSTLLWAPGEIVSDGYVVPVDADAPPGEYYLNVGYYFTVGEAAIYLPLVVDGQMSNVNSITIGPIEVVAPLERADVE